MTPATLLDAAAIRRALALRDLSDPAQGPHALQTLLADLRAALTAAWGCELRERREPPVVSLADNYDDLGYSPEGAARDARYTRYLGPDTLLRTQTSALVPRLLRELAAAPPRDLLLVCPGLVYRRDAVDRLHTGEPHQVDLWRLRTGAPLGAADLREMIELVVAALLPGWTWRANPAQHPYTRDGLEVEVRAGEEWVELGECGLACPALLERAGLDPARTTGLATGLGLDRALMLRKGIPDIRLLRAGDPRVAAQLLDLAPYRPVSSQPAIRRDLSLAVATGTSPEELGDRVRVTLGERAESVEEVAVLAVTAADALPTAARARIGIGPGQENVLLRLVLRHPVRTLTAVEANHLRDEVYAALHEGTAWEWSRGRGG